VQLFGIRQDESLPQAYTPTMVHRSQGDGDPTHLLFVLPVPRAPVNDVSNPGIDDADIKDHHLGRSPRTRASCTSHREPIAKPAKTEPHHEQRFPRRWKKSANVAHFSVASQLESDGLRAYVRAVRIGNRATHRRHSAHNTGTRACGAVWEEALRCPRASRIPAHPRDTQYTLQIAHNKER
jgi:hypothetical protein